MGGQYIRNIEKKFNLSDRKRKGYQIFHIKFVCKNIRGLTTSKVQEQNLPPNKDS